MKTKKMTTPHLKKSIGRSPLRLGFLLIPVAFACFALSPQVRAQGFCRDDCDGFTNTWQGVAALQFNIGSQNTAIGSLALFHNTTASFNTAIGADALRENTTGEDNTATGSNALKSNTTGPFNTAMGESALYSNTTGDRNTAMGVGALIANSTGASNTAVGVSALRNNTSAAYNTAVGHDALVNNNSSYNAAVGYQALFSNTTGSGNTANGANALYRNAADYNTANGFAALYTNGTGTFNTANGAFALYSNRTGNYNTAFGVNALLNNAGSSNVGLGAGAGRNLTTGSGNVCIGAGIPGAAGESNTTRIRNIYSSVASARPVYVNSNNKIGTLASTRRVKNDIKPMDKASEAVLALKPVSFRYKKEIDDSGTPQFGLVAEEVADINADLVTRDSEGKPETVRYEAVNAMLLNEFLKEHRRNEQQEATIARQQRQIEALTAGLQKVSAQLEVSKPGPQTVLNNQ
jgi:trimeric autotransporter adhesin